MKTGKIIAHCGHGTGKTAAVFFHAGTLKIHYPQHKITIVNEVARDCPYPINQATTPEAQNWVFCKQIGAELEAVFQHDLVVSDRSVFDCIAYAMAAGFLDQAQNMVRLAMPHYLAFYKKIVFHFQHHHCDTVIDTDHAFRIEVEQNLIALFSEHKIPFEVYYANPYPPTPPCFQTNQTSKASPNKTGSFL